MFDAVLGESIIKRARRKGLVSIKVHDIRDYTDNKHRKIDDKPFGGGPGMVLKIEPIYKAIKHILGKEPANKKRGVRVIFLTPQGKKYNQETARRLSKFKRLILVCGHYEGLDERARKALVDEEISIGDYVLTCGELPGMVIIDSIVRLIPGVLGHEQSNISESFENGLLDYPQYTRPAVFKNLKVPKVLLSGDHKKIEKWRTDQAYKRTRERRPDLLKCEKK